MNKKNNKKTANKYTTAIILVAIILIAFPFFIFYYLSSNNNTKTDFNYTPQSSFATSMAGETWIINDDNIAVGKQPKTFSNKQAFINNVVTIIKPGTKVEILESKGIVSPWKRVNVFNNQNKVFAQGWVLAETVKDAKKQ